MTDIVIPLSKESPDNNLQLRLAIRSIAKYAKNLGNIHIYSAAKLPWLKDINIVPMEDPVKDCKDVNLINKIKAAANNPDVADRFMFWSDDQLLTAELDLDKAPVVANERGLNWFLQNKATNKWYVRMLNTMQYVKKEAGLTLNWNYDSHVPQPYRKDAVLDIFSRVPYTVQPGFCINTIYYGMLRQPYTKQQREVKVNFEGKSLSIPTHMKLYAGHDPQCWKLGAAAFFTGFFYDKCRFEQ